MGQKKGNARGADLAQVRSRLLDDIDQATEPSKMTKPEAREVLSDIIDELRGRIEALDEEIAEED